MSDLEQPELSLGLVPLIDAAPLIMAREQGFFEKHGLEVALSVEGSWASVRDKVAAGLLDGAHMLAPMPIAATLGVDGVGVPMLTALSLNLNGNAIALSEALYWRLAEAGGEPLAIGRALRDALARDRIDGRPKPVFAHVFPFSTHHYELRYWLAASGIDPDHDVQLVVVPPPQMVDALRDGRIDGFCVGAPWGAAAEATGAGRIVVRKHQIWNNSPEKVLGVTAEWAAAHPRTHRALIAALIETSVWLRSPEHRRLTAETLIREQLLSAPDAVILAALESAEDKELGGELVFHDGAATFPWVSHAVWFMRQMQRWRQIPDELDPRAIAPRIYRSDLYREAARPLGLPCPLLDFKSEGLHSESWQSSSLSETLNMGADRFIDGAVFDASPAASAPK